MTLLILIHALLAALALAGIVPIDEVKLYPNTEGSPSLYMISFQTTQTMEPGEFMLVNFDWLTLPLNPHDCLLVNTTLDISCTVLDDSPSDFQAAIDTYNSQIDPDRTLVVTLTDGLVANTPYYLELTLHNQVENMAKISPSMEVYLLNKDGLVYQENLNFGSIVYKPPITNLLSVSILTSLSNNVPG